ncbi:MAG: peptidoglycan DD-metalloendopeptidase family protein [Gammaproteobacteria bacterium]|nr:peptidoglycan DD-metalloendopeptidase family protein [Gammaproteobacteria bacterium]MBU1625079.1 peptidoglycan DD-metalloendopeptidase family protein [Gammaproteobacteria bacterium]MBU1981339.1 peptidoglycan DD-metalloendopeptidase family protein [Gammaproteobacteria bacterium]
MTGNFSKALHTSNILIALLLAALLTACAGPAASGKRAPIVEYGSGPVLSAADKPAETSTIYVVQAGDTLYSIAFQNGLDYMEVAQQNGLKDPTAIQVGQKLRLIVPAEEVVSEEPTQIVTRIPRAGEIKNQPKVGRLLYSAQALAKAQHIQDDEPSTTSVASAAPASTVVEEGVEWGMPTRGKVIAGYSKSANRKGVDIAGSQGQPILASASGKVVYSGSGLRGYGKLVIIKHNATFLSAYAHNNRLLVKEGQSVRKGQKIAEMGNSDTDQVKLHFEIRKMGKPVDPAKYLPLIKS